MKRLLTSAAVAFALLTGTVAIAQEKGAGTDKTSKNKKKAPKKGSEKRKAEQPKAQ